MADIRRIPFSEIYERVKNELVRDATADTITENKYKGRVNNAYMYDIPSQIDYRHIAKTGTIPLLADYSTGTVAVTNASTTITGTDTVWTSAAHNNFLIKLGNYNEVYRFTYASSTTGTLDRIWVEATADNSDEDETYVLYQDRYALASDFDRMIQDPDECVWYWSQGHKVYLRYQEPGEFRNTATNTVGTPDTYTIEWVNDDPYIFTNPPSTGALTLEYKYIPTLARMTEYITGTITTLANAGTAVTGSGTAWSTYMTAANLLAYNYYFRIDGDGTGSSSVWYKISAAGAATSVTLSDAYGGTAISTGTSAYTISRVSLLPAGLDSAIMYATAMVSAVDQDNTTQTKSWAALYEKLLMQYKAVEGRGGYGKSRISTIYEKYGVRR